MKSYVQKTALGILVLLLAFKSYAQITPVQVTPQLVPPYSLQVNEYYSGTIPKIQVLLINRDINQPTIKVKLKMTVESQNCRLRTKEVNTTPPLNYKMGFRITYLLPSCRLIFHQPILILAVASVNSSITKRFVFLKACTPLPLKRTNSTVVTL
ncbi:MAG: hypothetical protein K2X48_09150 [Chitinophagaceae bacterium]|nr:hypothetical protein [Chitinophagaceae bacterium]